MLSDTAILTFTLSSPLYLLPLLPTSLTRIFTTYPTCQCLIMQIKILVKIVHTVHTYKLEKQNPKMSMYSIFSSFHHFVAFMSLSFVVPARS